MISQKLNMTIKKFFQMRFNFYRILKNKEKYNKCKSKLNNNNNNNRKNLNKMI